MKLLLLYTKKTIKFYNFKIYAIKFIINEIIIYLNTICLLNNKNNNKNSTNILLIRIIKVILIVLIK